MAEHRQPTVLGAGFFLVAALALTAGGAEPRADAGTRYCVPVVAFDFNPFREINDGKELAYLVFMRSFISTVLEEPGILSQYEFSPDGRRFLGRVSESSRWADGSPLTAREAARTIAEGLRHRPIGRRVRVIGERVIDARTFELRLESKMENVTGALREALSTNSRQNRLWAAHFRFPKTGPVAATNPVEALGRFPFGYKNGRPGFTVGTHFVGLAAQGECAAADYGIFRGALSSGVEYEAVRSSRPQAVTFEPSTKRLSLEKRKAVAAWLRGAFRSAPASLGLELVPGFFLPGEPGHDPAVSWPADEASSWQGEETLTLGIENPVFRTVLAEAAARQGKKIVFVDFPLGNIDVDGQLLSSAIHDGRQIILQDLLTWSFVEEMMSGAPRTRASLRLIAARSASTIPPDAVILKEFEAAARDEYALVPVARRNILAYTKLGAPLRLEWLPAGEPVFRER